MYCEPRVYWNIAVLVLFLVVSVLIALYARKTAEKGLEGFFLGGKNLPWYLAGLSMVATTFAADTPLAVTELVNQHGISGNWVWWNMLLGGMFTAVFYAQLWRRSGVLTETEFITLRYQGKAALYLKKFKSIYLGLFMNAIILAWVNLALMSIIQIFFPVDPKWLFLIMAGIMLVVALYSAVSGLLGIALTDAFQFFIALAGCIALAVLVLKSEQIGGISGMKDRLPAGSLDFLPSLQGGKGSLSMGLASFLAFAGMIWWSSWYPGAEPGGGGYIAQRMLSTKNKKHSFLATFFFQFAHYGLRPWPWIIVALCSILLFPTTDHRVGFVMVMRDFLPVGLKGLLLASFFGAYMSTVSTHLNWGASYIINDLYPWRRKSDKQIVRASRILTLFIMVLALLGTTQIESISGVWQFIMECGAGLGLLLMLRWFWFRINAWSEITATVTPFVVYGVLKLGLAPHYPRLGLSIAEDPTSFFITVGVTTLAWVLVTIASKKPNTSSLDAFNQKVYPSGFQQFKSKFPALFAAWFGGILAVYCFLFSMGKLILQEVQSGLILLVICMLGAFLFHRSARKAGLYD